MNNKYYQKPQLYMLNKFQLNKLIRWRMFMISVEAEVFQIIIDIGCTVVWWLAL